MSKLKVSLVNTNDVKGGAAQNTLTLFDELKKNGILTNYFVGNKASLRDDIQSFKGRIDIPGVNYFINKLGLRDIIVKSNDLFGFEQFQKSNIIHLNNIHGGVLNVSSLAPIFKNKKVVWTFHDMWPFVGNSPHELNTDWWNPSSDKFMKECTLLDRVLFNQKRKIYENVNFKIVTPSYWLQKLVKKSILREFDTKVIPNGIDINIFRPLGRKEELLDKYNVPSNKFVAIFVSDGGLSNPWKGGEYMVQVLKALPKYKDILFLEIGAKVPNIVRDSNHWKFPSTYDKKAVNELMNLGDIFLFTSVAENFPIVILEAQAVGLPVVAFDVGGVKEIVQHMKTGYIGAYKSPDDIVTGVVKILSDIKSKERMGKMSRDNIVNNFTKEVMCSSYIKLYKDYE